jgi:hypothetical protein
MFERASTLALKHNSTFPSGLTFVFMSPSKSHHRITFRSKQSRAIRLESLESRALFAADAIGEIVPDFQLTDVNPNSAAYSTNFSPRDLVGQTGAFYFVRST